MFSLDDFDISAWDRPIHLISYKTLLWMHSFFNFLTQNANIVFLNPQKHFLDKILMSDICVFLFLQENFD